MVQTFSLFLAIVMPCLSGIAHAREVTPPPPSEKEQVHPGGPEGTEPGPARGLDITRRHWTGDFNQMLERRAIRVVLPYSRTLYFNDRGRQRGITADFVRDFERYLNEKHAKRLGNRPLTIVMVPATRDRMFMDVASGFADIAAGNLTVTPERLKHVDFAVPTGAPVVSELLVTGPKSPGINSLDDLSGKIVHVRKASSYYESLLALNDRFRAKGKSPVGLVLLPEELEDEDIMEMLNAGLFEATVVKDWLAKIWATVLPKIKVRTDLIIHTDERIGWAIRKGSPKLNAEIRDFFKDYVQKGRLIESRLASYMKRIKQIKDPTGTAEWKRFEQTIALFKQYGNRYGFDPLMLVAQGYQESLLDQTARSEVGAIGIMQLMPATGAAMKVGDITITEANIHAGAKYMDYVMKSYCEDARFSDFDRPLFAFASYNAGPGKIAKMRKLAEKRGYDPNKWLNNVEIVTAQKIGLETTTYVRNIFKYYAAYKLSHEANAAQRKAREQIANEQRSP
ncbi:MAG: transporter substrate-binding domain-containing protein [Nitrospiraceae bacterium]